MLLNLSRLATGIVWRIMTVIQILNSPKNLMWRLKWVEDNESCHSVFVFLVSLNLSGNFWGTLRLALFLLRIQFPLFLPPCLSRGTMSLSLTLSFPTYCFKKNNEQNTFFLAPPHLRWSTLCISSVIPLPLSQDSLMGKLILGRSR